MTNWIDLLILVVYVIGITLFGCSFFFRKGSGDANTFMSGGMKLPTWTIALSIFATHVSSLSFLGLPAKAFLTNWNPYVLSMTVPVAAAIAALWFIPFYRNSGCLSANTFLERRFGTWARLYASACFIIMQSARAGVILYLLALLMKSVLGYSVVSIILITGIATIIYSMMGGLSAVVWTDAIQSLILIGGTVLCIVLLGFNIPNLGEGISTAWDAGKFSLGSLSLSDWSTETFWVTCFYAMFINLQNFGIDQSFTQRYVAAKTTKAAVKSLLSSAFLYLVTTLLFVLIGSLLWIWTQNAPEQLPAEVAAHSDAVFPWFIVHKLPVGASGLLVAAIVAAAMSTVSTTLNSGATVLLEDYWKRFFPARVSEKSNIAFLRYASIGLGLFAVVVAVAVMNVTSALTAFWAMQSVLSGGMLGLFLLGAFSRRCRPTRALIAAICGFAVLIWVTFGQKILPLPQLLHINLAIVLGTLTLVLIGAGCPWKRGNG